MNIYCVSACDDLYVLFRFTQIYGGIQELNLKMEDTEARMTKIDYDNDRLSDRLVHEQKILTAQLQNSKIDMSVLMRSLGVTPGLAWKDVGSEKPKTGTEIDNQPLAVALQERVEFSHKELDTFNVHDLSYNSCIKVGDKYFQPGSPERSIEK